MSLTINLMTNLSDENVLSKNLTTLSTVTGTLRDRCSILNPIILIEGALPTNCNYFQIEEFNRYYYIKDVVSVRNNLFEISGHVDVLKTYESQIRACTGIVLRQKEKYNLYLDDGVFKTYQNPTFRLEVFDSGFTDWNFVLAVAGSGGSSESREDRSKNEIIEEASE